WCGDAVLEQAFLHLDLGGGEGKKGRRSAGERHTGLLQSLHNGQTRIAVNLVAIAEIEHHGRRSLASSAYGCQLLLQMRHRHWDPAPQEVESHEPGLHLSAVGWGIEQGALNATSNRRVGNKHVDFWL